MLWKGAEGPLFHLLSMSYNSLVLNDIVLHWVLLIQKNSLIFMYMKRKTTIAPNWYTNTKNFSRNYNAHNSSFWIDDRYKSISKEDSVDVVMLAGYKRAISNFVRIVTGKTDIPVNFSSGKDSYASASEVVISSKLEAKDFDTTVGLALHEGSHILLTDYAFSKTAFSMLNTEVDRLYRKHMQSKNGELVIARLKTLCNIIEDRRIDKFIYDTAPGYRGYYIALYNAHFYSKIIDQVIKSNYHNKVEWASYEFYLINLLNPNINFDVLPGLREIAKKISVSTIDRLKSTQDSFALAVEVYEMIFDILGWTGQSNPQPKLNNSGNGTNDDSSNDRQEKSEEPSNTDSGSSEPEESDKSEESDEAGDSSSSDPEESEDNSTSEEENDDMGSGDPNLDLPNVQGDISSESSQAGSTSSSTELSASEKRRLEAAIDKQKEFLEGRIKKSRLRKKDVVATINALAAADCDFVDVAGDVEYINRHGDKTSTRFAKTKCMVLRGFSEQLLKSNVLNNQYRSWSKDTPKYISEGIAIGTILGKRLKTRDENRNLKTTRISKGKIENRLLAELGFGNEKVFSETAHFTVTPSVIHISVDASGSMDGLKWSSAMKTAIALAKAATMVESLQCIISVRGILLTRPSVPLMWIVYDSKVDSFSVIQKHFGKLYAGGPTPEGLCFEAISKEIIKTAAGRDSYFINLSDGQPIFGIDSAEGSNGNTDYSGLAAAYHTKHQVDRFRKSNIKVLSYFITTDPDQRTNQGKHDAAAFKIMYGKDASMIDVNNLNLLSNTLNQLFVRNND